MSAQVDGMWNPSNGFTYDFATIVYRWQLLGFNAIRVPFSMKDLYSTATPTNKLSPTCSLPTFVSTGSGGVLDIKRYVNRIACMNPPARKP